MKIDWFIPFHGKDSDTLRLSIESIRKNFANVGRIFIVSNESITMSNEEVYVIEEPSALDCVEKSEIALKFLAMTGSSSRTGWVWQQLLKLNADSIVKDISEVFVWQDSDVLWCRQQQWHLADADSIIGKVDEYHIPYFRAFQRITGELPALNFSTIRHHAYVRRNVLMTMRTDLANFHGSSFSRAIVDSLDYTENSNFSEYDMYANWCVMSSKRVFVCDLIWKNIDHIPSSLPNNYDFLAPQKWMRRA